MTAIVIKYRQDLFDSSKIKYLNSNFRSNTENYASPFYCPITIAASWSSPTIGQCGNEDWTSTFAIAGDSTSQCTSSVSYVNGLSSKGYGTLLETGPGVIKAARCCSVNQPYSQESKDCYKAQWWTDLQRYVKV